MRRVDMTELQRLLHDEYFRRWGERREAAARVARILGTLAVARASVQAADASLQTVYRLMLENGMDMEPIVRTWPIDSPKECILLTGNEAVAVAVAD